MAKTTMHHLIRMLRGEQFCLYEVLESGQIPEALLGVLVCDYVEHLQLRLDRAGVWVNARGMEAIEVKRRWLDGKASNADLGRMRAVVQQQMTIDPIDTALFFAWAATFASSEKAFCSLLEGLRRRSPELPFDFADEVRWIGRRLALYLDEHLQQAARPWLPLFKPAPHLPRWSFTGA